jgi:hypothetical protein
MGGSGQLDYDVGVIQAQAQPARQRSSGAGVPGERQRAGCLNLFEADFGGRC